MGAGTRSWRPGKRRFSTLPANHLLLLSILRDGARDSDKAICIDDA